MKKYSRCSMKKGIHISDGEVSCKCGEILTWFFDAPPKGAAYKQDKTGLSGRVLVTSMTPKVRHEWEHRYDRG